MVSEDFSGHEHVDDGGQVVHQPVLLDEVLTYLAPRPGGSYIDGTFGGGGHTRAILAVSAPDGRVLGLDADPDAIARGRSLVQEAAGRLDLRQGNFADIAEHAQAAGFKPVDGVLLDLGLSSFQLEEPARGFAFRLSGPLDMRFDPTAALTAAEIVNAWSEPDIARLLYQFGDEPKARRIARAIVAERRRGAIETTDQLAALVERVVGGRRGRAIHPATKTFQALRIAVNRELDVLGAGLRGALDLLAPGGRMVVISFHSLEDRMVKNVFRTEASGCICPPSTPVCVCGHEPRVRVLTAKPVRPTATEEARNPRSRSARLRAVERLP